MIRCYNARMKLVLFAVLAMTLTILACALPTVEPTPDPGAFETQVAEGVAATLKAAPTSTPSPAPAATDTETPRLMPTPFTPRSEVYPEVTYILQEEKLFGEYAVRFWRNANAAADTVFFDGLVTIAASGEGPIQIESASALGAQTGTDITGDGFSEVIVETYSGGAHCCFGTVVYSMKGSSIQKVLDTAPSNCGGSFADLDGDGVLEFDTCDDSFAYTYCPYAASPIVRVIFQYDPAQGLYLPASPRFASLYADLIAEHTKFAEETQPGELGEWDGSNKCSVLPAVLDYLYSGQTDQAWAEFSRLYTAPDADTFRAEIEKVIEGSGRYVRP